MSEGDGRLGEGLGRLDGQAAVGLADLLGVVVEEGDDVEAPVVEPPIFQQGPAQVPPADQGRRPDAVDPEDAPEGLAQLLDPVADARVAELPEEGEVLADLGVVDRQGRAEPAAGDGRLALALEGFELAEVEAHPADDGLGGQLVSRWARGEDPAREGSVGQASGPISDRPGHPRLYRIRRIRSSDRRLAPARAGCPAGGRRRRGR